MTGIDFHKQKIRQGSASRSVSSGVKLLYFSFVKPHYSIDGIYIKGLRENGVEVVEFFYPQKSLQRYLSLIRDYLQHRRDVSLIIVGYTSGWAAVALSLVTTKKIIYNTLCSEYERMIVSRGLAKPFSLKAFYYWLQDYLATHLASMVMLESQHQIDYFAKLFKIKGKKCFLAWTGVNDEVFKIDPIIKKLDRFTVLFRGRLLPEAGAEVVVQAAKELENEEIDFLLLAGGQESPKIQKLIDDLKPRNLTWRTEFLSEEEMLQIMQRCHLSLGQLGKHERLTRTIPHKAYESIALRLSYLTARNPAVMELLQEGETCLAFEPGDSHDLAQKVLWAKNNPDQLSEIAENGYRLYENQLTPKLLAQSLLEELKNRKMFS